MRSCRCHLTLTVKNMDSVTVDTWTLRTSLLSSEYLPNSWRHLGDLLAGRDISSESQNCEHLFTYNYQLGSFFCLLIFSGVGDSKKLQDDSAQLQRLLSSQQCGRKENSAKKMEESASYTHFQKGVLSWLWRRSAPWGGGWFTIQGTFSSSK